jgi:hypothetical protein
MAAPSATTRATPAGIPLQDGYQSLVTFANDTDISFWEKSVTPPAMEGGDPVNTTTMHNSAWFTKAPRALTDLEPMTLTAAYDPDAYNQILAIINERTTVTVKFKDGSTLAFYGYLQRFEPGELVEGTQPECTITLVPTNWDPTNNVEAAPVLTSAAGT